MEVVESVQETTITILAARLGDWVDTRISDKFLGVGPAKVGY